MNNLTQIISFLYFYGIITIIVLLILLTSTFFSVTMSLIKYKKMLMRMPHFEVAAENVRISWKRTAMKNEKVTTSECAPNVFIEGAPVSTVKYFNESEFIH